MDPEYPTYSWCLVCRRRLTLPDTSGHGSDVPIILCLPEKSPRVPFDYEREGHNGIYLLNTFTTDNYKQLNLPSPLFLAESNFEEFCSKFPPIQDPIGLHKPDPVNGYAMPELLEPVPQVVIQTSKMVLNG